MWNNYKINNVGYLLQIFDLQFLVNHLYVITWCRTVHNPCLWFVVFHLSDITPRLTYWGLKKNVVMLTKFSSAFFWKRSYFDSNFTEVCSIYKMRLFQGYLVAGQVASHLWSNTDPIHWRIYPLPRPSYSNTIYWQIYVSFRLNYGSVWILIMTSSNANIFHVTAPLWGESTSYRWIPRTKASNAELWSFLWSAPE